MREFQWEKEEMKGERCGDGDWHNIFEALKSSDVSFFATSFSNFIYLILNSRRELFFCYLFAPYLLLNIFRVFGANQPHDWLVRR